MSLRNHRQSQQPIKKMADWVADASHFIVIKSIAIAFVPASRWDLK